MSPEENDQGFEEGSAGQGAGAPTPLSALEVRFEYFRRNNISVVPIDGLSRTLFAQPRSDFLLSRVWQVSRQEILD